jgi:hypothetical protein
MSRHFASGALPPVHWRERCQQLHASRRRRRGHRPAPRRSPLQRDSAQPDTAGRPPAAPAMFPPPTEAVAQEHAPSRRRRSSAPRTPVYRRSEWAVAAGCSRRSSSRTAAPHPQRSPGRSRSQRTKGCSGEAVRSTGPASSLRAPSPQWRTAPASPSHSHQRSPGGR